MSKTTTNIAPNSNIYKYTANMKYILNNEVNYIDIMNIKTIAIDSNYDEMNMPMIFITLGVYKSLANKMILNQDKGLVILDIKRCITNSDMPDLYSDYINDKFIYFITGEIDESISISVEEDELYDETMVTIGLLSLDHVNKNKKPVNGVLNGKLSSVMYYLTSHLPILIEPPKNNIIFSNKFLPPMNSVSKALKYINSINVFYPTAYRFFIDFNQSYLISSSGNPIKSKGENISTINITIHHKKDNAESMLQGMTINKSQSLYHMYASSGDCDISDNSFLDKTFSKISAINTSGKRIDANLSTTENSPIVKKIRSIRILNDNNEIVNNMVSTIDSSSIQLMVQKTDIDASVFTINKEYIIKANDAYNTDAYNGRYILVRKRELYVREDTDFTTNIMLLFRKVSDNKSAYK